MTALSKEKIKEFEIKANDIRQSIIEMLVEAKSGHTAGPLGMADIFTLFYFHILKHNPKNPSWADRDRLILSNGHICPVFYASMAHSGYFPIEELKTLRKFGSRLQGHPHREYLPFVENSSGPLGSGISQAAGMALADKIDGSTMLTTSGSTSFDKAQDKMLTTSTKDRYIYCFISDGELDEGNSWEGIMFAGKNKLNNLIVIVDRNNIQIDGNTEKVMPLEPLKDKWSAFNWHVIEVNGHDFNALNDGVLEAQKIIDKPIVIIAHTIPGKGVSFMEHDYKWHGMPPNKEQGEMALKELKDMAFKIKNA
ncbi:MAG: transketolase [Candidatus Paceibacterota bacterium]